MHHQGMRCCHMLSLSDHAATLIHSVQPGSDLLAVQLHLKGILLAYSSELALMSVVSVDLGQLAGLTFQP